MKTGLMLIFVLLLSNMPFDKARNDSQEIFTDLDDNTYKVVRIGDQCWMAENLKVTRDRDGNTIQSYCFDDDENNCEKLGRLYTWDVALKVSPDG